MRNITIACLMLTLHLAYAQGDERKKMLDLAFAIRQSSGLSGGTALIPTDYVMDKDGKIIGQNYLSTDWSSRYTVTNEGTLTLYVYGDQINSAGQSTPGCGGPYNFSLDEFVITYNDQNQATKLAQKFWSQTSKGNYVKRNYDLEYANAKISKVTYSEIIGTGKSSSAVTTEFEYPNKVTAVEWKDNEVTMITTSYRRRFKKKDPTTVESVNKYFSRIEKGKVYSVSGSKQEMIREYVTNGNQVTYTYTNPDYKQKAVTVYTHDAKGLATSEIESDYKDNQLTEKREITVQYIVKDTKLPSDTPCNYTVRNMANIYDGKGNLIQESNDQGTRVKNADGTWGPWKGWRY